MPKAKNTKTEQNRTKKKTSSDNKTVSQTLVSSSLKGLPGMTTLSSFKLPKKTWLVVLILGILLLAYYKKNWFVAAMVNGSPITTIQLMQQLNQQYKDQVLTQIINERIILDEAQKNNVVVTSTEVNDRISQLEKNVGGAQVLDNLLAQQGQTRDGLTGQIRIQLSVEKMYQSETTSSAQEVQSFIDQNKDKLTASDSAGQVTEAQDLLKQQKLSKVFSEKFQQLKQQANIQIF